MAHHLAQVNIARLAAPLDSEQLADFVAGLEPVNALADASPGFVWRLQSEDGGDATSIRPFEDDDILVNMSVWESVEALVDFTYRTDHKVLLRRRREFFRRVTAVDVGLWWVPVGHEPDPAEARERLDHLAAHGPTAHAFTFRQPFPAPA